MFISLEMNRIEQGKFVFKAAISLLIVFFRAPLTQQQPRVAYIAAKKPLPNKFNPFSLTYMNLCRNICRSGSTPSVTKIQSEKPSAPVLSFIMCYLPLLFHDKVTREQTFWRNAGSEAVFRLLPSFLLLKPLASPQNPTGLQSLHTAFTGSGCSLPSSSFPCSALYGYFTLSTESLWRAETFSR